LKVTFFKQQGQVAVLPSLIYPRKKNERVKGGFINGRLENSINIFGIYIDSLLGVNFLKNRKHDLIFIEEYMILIKDTFSSLT